MLQPNTIDTYDLALLLANLKEAAKTVYCNNAFIEEAKVIYQAYELLNKIYDIHYKIGEYSMLEIEDGK